MGGYRRNTIPGGRYFFTVTLLDRASRLLVERHYNPVAVTIPQTRACIPRGGVAVFLVPPFRARGGEVFIPWIGQEEKVT